MKNLKNLKGARALNKIEQQIINGGGNFEDTDPGVGGGGSLCYCGNGTTKQFASADLCQGFCGVHCSPHSYGCG